MISVLVAAAGVTSIAEAAFGFFSSFSVSVSDGGGTTVAAAAAMVMLVATVAAAEA